MTGALDVLVVDDEEKICQLLEQILSARGCAVRISHDGLQALAEFKRQPANVVITDITAREEQGRKAERRRRDSSGSRAEA